VPEAAGRADACRIDVWLWRARFFKTRAQSGAWVQTGRIRLRRGGAQSRPDKPSRNVKVGDELVFAIGGRLAAMRIEELGTRRGPPAEARTLYRPLETYGDPRTLAIDNEPWALKNTPAAPTGHTPHPPRLLDDLHRH
jgi:ribosomal 50S subunit-recycling heat shock protein